MRLAVVRDLANHVSVLLKSDSITYLGYIIAIEIDKENIFIVEKKFQNGILRFDRNGTFIAKNLVSLHGPNSLRSIDDIALVQDEDKIYVLDELSAQLVTATSSFITSGL